MPLLQALECPEDIYRKTTIAAKNEDRTIAQQAVVLIRKNLGQQGPYTERRKRLLAKIENRHISNEVKAIDATAMVGGDRDR